MTKKVKSAQLHLYTVHRNRLNDLFLEYNTAIPSSAAIERFFSLVKKILKPKRSGLSDNHFQMLLFLKGISEKSFSIISSVFFLRHRL